MSVKNIIESVQHNLLEHIQNKFSLDRLHLKNIDIALQAEASKQQFGDITTNAPLVLAKLIGKNPREIAQAILDFKHEYVEKLEIAGPGFINIFLTTQAIKDLAKQLYLEKDAFFKSPLLSSHPSIHPIGHSGRAVAGETQVTKKNLDHLSQNIIFDSEFVSANPTGPLHLGHGRGAIIGDVLGNIIKFIGNDYTKEFYINDAGNQIQKLGHSFKIRCQQELGETIDIPEDGYHGLYLVELAKKVINEFGKDVLNKQDSWFSEYAKQYMLANIKGTLEDYGVFFDVWFSEKTLHDSGAIKKALEKLEANGHLYEAEGALWFRSTTFGDDKDRVLKKNTGEYTYAAADVAYTENKFARGFNKLVIILGQDHHSYLQRLKGITQALGHNPDNYDVILYQLVTLKESGALLKMSKRAGRGITLQDVIDEVGKDVARFFYLNRKADAHLEFDIDLALKHTDENPVYYIQYAYVRTKSILEKAADIKEFNNINEQDIEFIGTESSILIKKIVHLKTLLNSISSNYQTHLLTYYCLDLAQSFHAYYSANRVIDENNIQASRSRLLIIKIVNENLKRCFKLLGIEAPEKM